MGKPYARPNSSLSITNTLNDVWLNREHFVARNYESLASYSFESKSL